MAAQKLKSLSSLLAADLAYLAPADEAFVIGGLAAVGFNDKGAAYVGLDAHMRRSFGQLVPPALPCPVDIEGEHAAVFLKAEGERHDVGDVSVAKAQTYGIAAFDKRTDALRLRYGSVMPSHQNRYTLISYGLVVKPFDITKLFS